MILLERFNMKNCYIIQPGRIGDIIICLPIADYYHNQGYKITWFVHESMAVLFDYVDYVNCSIIKNSEGDLRHSVPIIYKKLASVKPGEKDIILDLSIGFAGHKDDNSWKNEGLSFDRWKYKEAKVTFGMKYLLNIKRNKQKEKRLANLLRLPSAYNVIHEVGSRGSYQFTQEVNIRTVPVLPIENFTVFDWIPILNGAKKIFCVDSCISNLINQLSIGIGRRFFRPWDRVRTQKRKILMPEIASDWRIIEPGGR